MSPESLIHLRKQITAKARGINAACEQERQSALQHAEAMVSLSDEDLLAAYRAGVAFFDAPSAPSLGVFEVDESRIENSSEGTRWQGNQAFSEFCGELGLSEEIAGKMLERLTEENLLASNSCAETALDLLRFCSSSRIPAATLAAVTVAFGSSTGITNTAQAARISRCSVADAESEIARFFAEVRLDLASRPAHPRAVADALVAIGFSMFEAVEIEAELRAKRMLATGKEAQAVARLAGMLLSGAGDIRSRALAFALATGAASDFGFSREIDAAAEAGISRQRMSIQKLAVADDLGTSSGTFRRSERARKNCRKAQLAGHWRKQSPLAALRKKGVTL